MKLCEPPPVPIVWTVAYFALLTVLTFLGEHATGDAKIMVTAFAGATETSVSSTGAEAATTAFEKIFIGSLSVLVR